LPLVFGVQGPMISSKNNLKPIPIMTSPTQKFKSKTSQLLFNQSYTTFRIFRGFEQLSISIAWLVMLAPFCAQQVAHAGLSVLKLSTWPFSGLGEHSKSNRDVAKPTTLFIVQRTMLEERSGL